MKLVWTNRILVAFIAMGMASQVAADEWNFDVFLDGKKVGTHVFEVMDADDQRQVQSTANFKVKILFFTAYSYEHTNAERWADNCLLTFDSNTKVNGEPTAVSGATGEGGFIVENATGQELMPDCVMSFAYWNPAFLQEEQLLNPQTGELLDVEIELMGTEDLEVRGEQVAAERYKITAQGIDLMVWYSGNNEWVALESVAEKGHIIRYELS